jgi:TonB family protein
LIFALETLALAVGFAGALQPAIDVAPHDHLGAALPRTAKQRSGGIRSKDYPASALRAGAQGAVDMRLMIGTQGRIESCEIVQSSGHAILDEAGCGLATRRWIYFPAVGVDGRPKTEMRLQRIDWRLPNRQRPQRDADLERYLRAAQPGPARFRSGSISDNDYPAAALRAGAEGVVTAHFTVTASGRVFSCVIAESSGNSDLDTRSCLIVIDRFFFLPAIGTNRRPVAQLRVQRFVWRLPGQPGATTE